MGMSASQGRLLMLTARKTDLERQGQNIAERRLILAGKLEEAANVYETSTTNRHLYFKTKDDGKNPPRLTYANITGSAENGGLNYKLVDAKGNIVLDKEDPEKTDGYVVDATLNNIDRLEHTLRTGTYFIQVPEMNGDLVEWKNKSVEQISRIWDEKYDHDNAAAEARFASLKQQVSTQDKSLELELKGVETEHKAIATEFESVQKLIMNNVEKSYKMFNA